MDDKKKSQPQNSESQKEKPAEATQGATKPDHNEDTLLKFPCEFTFKVFGKDTPEYKQCVVDIFKQHFKEADDPNWPQSWQQRHSKDNTYLALSISVEAKSKAQLDAVYEQLSAAKEVVMAL